MRIFLSYRRADVVGHAGRLSDTLVQRLGPKSVFQDVTAIGAGRDFVTAITAELDRCDAAIAVIGPGWLTASTPDGRRRLFEPDDYVRLEVVTVLQRDMPVVPVLVGGAALPAPDELPDDLRPLVQRQAIVVRDETWHQDVDHLLRSLRGQSVASAPRRRVGFVAGAVAALIALLVGLLAWRPWTSGSDDSGSTLTGSAPSALTGCPDPTGAEWSTLPVAADASAVDSRGKRFSVRNASYRRYKPGVWQIVVETALVNDTPETVLHADHAYGSILVAQRVFPQTCFDGRPGVVEPGTVGDGRSGYEVACQPGGRIELILGDSPRTRLLVTDGPSSPECPGAN